MIINEKTYVDMLIDLKVTPHQFMLPYLLYLDKQEACGKPLSESPPVISQLYRYAEKIKGWTYKDIDYLVATGYLINNNRHVKGKKREEYPDFYEVTDKFANIVFGRTNFEEFWDKYPVAIDNFDDPVNGRMIPLKTADYDELEKLYNKSIRSKKQHKELIESLDWAIKNDYINMSIHKYVVSRMWKSHMDIMKKKKDVPRTAI